MATLVFGEDAAIRAWVGARVGMPAIEGAAIGVARGRRLVAGVVYNGFTGRDVQVTCAADTPTWPTPDVLAGLLAYPFLQLGCARITCATELANRRVQRFLAHLGFRREGVLRDWFDTGDAAVYGLLRRDAARWLPKGTMDDVRQQAA